jgi:glucose/arabinose dehydrogenase/PKD repeat protein
MSAWGRTGRVVILCSALLSGVGVACSEPGADARRASGGPSAPDETRAASPTSPRPNAPDLGGIRLGLAPVASGLEAPLFATHSGDGSDRLYVVEQTGAIRIVEDGRVRAQPFLDLSDEIVAGGEQGLLGLAFHPGYARNGRLFVNYTDLRGDTVVAEYRRAPEDPLLAHPAAARVLLAIDQPFVNHNGGALAFGPDGYLYVATGDGGSTGDPLGNGQALDTLLGKLLRIDVDSDGSGAYGIPSDNPFIGRDDARAEVWAYGLRNPFRICIRPGTGGTDPAAGNPGVLFVGDVGWGVWEEQSIITAGGRNMGWPCYEGLNARSQYQNAQPAHHDCSTLGTPENPATHSPPVMTTHHSNAALSTPSGVIGNAAISGCFYTATTFPVAYRNHYFFADYGQNWIRVAQVNASHQITGYLPFATEADAPVDLDLDPSGNLVYVAIAANEVRRIRYTGVAGNTPPTAVAGAAPLVGLAPLAVTFSSTGTSDPDMDPLVLSWLFGDGQGATGASPQHTYTEPGRYLAVLTADDGQGGIGRDTVVVVALGSANFPTTPVLDNFNRPDGPIAGAWVDQTNGLNISGNALVQTCCLPTTVWSGQSFGPDQEAYIRFLAVTPGAQEQDLMLKVQGLSYSTGHIEVRWDANLGQVRVATYTQGTGWIQRAAFPSSFAPGDQLGARAYSNGVIETYKNGALLGTTSAGNWPFAAGGGYLGMTFAGAFSSRLDDFGGGDIVIDPNTPPTATVQAPADGSFYLDQQQVALTGVGADGEQAAGTLDYDWEVLLHHNTHTHPAFSASGPNASFTAENHEDGSGTWYEIALRVTDDGGLAHTATVAIYPEVDLEPSAVTFFPPSPTDQYPTEYSFWLHNRGRMPAPLSRWRLRVDGTTIAEGDSVVPALDSVQVTRTLPASFPVGTYALRVTGDTLEAVVETDETNNGRTQTMMVHPADPLGVPPPPQALALALPRPNPSRGAVTISLALPMAARVSLRIVDLQGRLVWKKDEQTLEAGRWPLVWPGRDLDGVPARSGIYLAEVRVDGGRYVRRMALLR